VDDRASRRQSVQGDYSPAGCGLINSGILKIPRPGKERYIILSYLILE
jgi:hypothetical protein